MKIIKIQSFPDYVEQVCSESLNGYLLRGVPDAEGHLLVPSIGRPASYQKLSLAQITSKEKHGLKRFRLEGSRHVSARSDMWTWMVLARHHGLPVRLLDWTRNPLVALYFAVWDKSGATAAVYAENFGKHIDIEAETDPFSVKKVAKFQPPHSSARVAAQASMLSIHPDPRKVHDSDNLMRFELSAKLVPHLKASLRRCGIHPATVFPDLDGLAASIRYENC
jgi:hypothetical protein